MEAVARTVDEPTSKLAEYDFQTREAVINYIGKHGAITPVPGEWWGSGEGRNPAARQICLATSESA
jgi:hypothetical protein